MELNLVFLQPGSTTDARRDARVFEASVGDILVLQGTTWPGRDGRGVVHRSPHVSEPVEPRLVFKIDLLGEGSAGHDAMVWR